MMKQHIILNKHVLNDIINIYYDWSYDDDDEAATLISNDDDDDIVNKWWWWYDGMCIVPWW